jgi:BirA family transcriptional regulator, biotin operon repressor / biotin---[acetyl-CoA-carboxylase] ligase
MARAHRPIPATDLLPNGPLQRLGRQVYLHHSIDSTNTFLLRHATAGDGAIAWTEWQSHGRGRLGHAWHAPRGSSLLLSVLFIEPPESHVITHAGVLAAVATAEAIEATTDCTIAVRWPNDLLCRERKVGGILAESSSFEARADSAAGDSPQRALVIGIGVNCLQQTAHFTGELAAKATSLELMSPQPIERGPLAATLLERLDHWIVACAAHADTLAALRRAWHDRCRDVGTRVELRHDDRVFAGTAVDIDTEGDLIVQLDHGGRRHFAAATTSRLW